MVTRKDLRAERDFYSPITGGTKISYSQAPERRDTYGSAVKTRMAGMQNVKSTRTNPIEAALVKVLKTEDPFTQIKEKKSYAPEEENDFMGALEGLGGTDEIADAVQDFVEPIVSSGSGRKSAQRRADQQFARQEKKSNTRTSTSELVARDNKRYGNTVPAGSFAIGSKPTDDFSKDPRYQSTADPTSDPSPIGGQGSSVNKLGATTQRQGNTIKDGVPGSWGGPAVNVSGHYSDNREKQKNLRLAQAQAKRVTPEVKATGIPTGLNLKAGSFGISQAGRDQAAINKGIAAAVKTGIPNQVAVQGGAMSQAARDQAAINKGIKAAEATGIPTKPVAGSFGISEAGRAEAAKNKAMAKAKAQAATKTSTVSTTTKQGVQRTKAQMAAAKRKASGTTSSQAKAANKTSMKQAAATRHAAFKKAKAAGTHTRTAAGQRARNKAAAKTRAKNAAKARNKAKGARRKRSRRGKKRCDIFLKFDISLLTNNNLRHDELAEVAYFVRALREVEL
tara:strand:- start:98 stop:1618 length:1521 start_codon:yes stop_codon:yes gene_type:complete